MTCSSFSPARWGAVESNCSQRSSAKSGCCCGARLVAHGLGGHQDIVGLLKKGSRRRRMTPGADVMPEADVS